MRSGCGRGCQFHHGALASANLQLKGRGGALLHRLLNAGGVGKAITGQALQRHAGNLAESGPRTG